MADETDGGAASAEAIADTLTVSASTFGRVLAQGMKNAVSEGYTLERVLKRAALSISSAALRESLLPLTSIVGKGASSLLGSLAGGLFGGAGAAVGAGSGGKLLPFAQGGVIGAPTTFAMPGGRVGLMGEAGREAVLPLARGPDGRLGVALEGGGGGGTTINVSIATPDVQGFARSEAQVTAALARAVARGRRGL